MKKLFLFTVLLAFALSASAQFFTYDGITYRITSDIKLTVEVDKGLNSPIVTIPSTVIGNDHKPYTVTSIGDFAFSYYTNLTEITIPNTVTSIGVHAFEYCKFTNVTIPNSVTTIGDYAFKSCYRLTYISLPNSIKRIGEFTFCDCINLTNVTIPNTVTSIGNSAFAGCQDFTDITIPNSVTIIDKYAFSSCDDLVKVTISNSVKTIGDLAFQYCRLTNVTIPNSVISIGEEAFQFCKSLESVSLGSNLKSIGNRIFTDCTALTKLISNAIVPPKCDAGAFDGIDKEKCTLFVPDEAVDSYKNAEQWKDFFSIQPTSIGETVANEGDSNIIGSVSVYNASGSLVKTFKDPNTLEDIITTLASGEYIIRYNGGALKILKD